jgi:hypothetical protein
LSEPAGAPVTVAWFAVPAVDHAAAPPAAAAEAPDTTLPTEPTVPPGEPTDPAL